jgi:hypothetical protein
MKTSLILTVLLSLGLANLISFRGSVTTPDTTPPFNEDNNNLTSYSQISEFSTAFFKHFNLDQPQQFIGCFNDITSKLYFQSILEFAKLAEDSEQRNSKGSHFELAKLALIGIALKSTNECIAKTDDFGKLLRHFNITTNDPEIYGLAWFIYYQAEFPKLAVSLKPIADSIQNNNYAAAGDAYAQIHDEAFQEIQSQGLASLAKAGFTLGEFIGLGLGDPTDSLKCWDSKSASLDLQFIYGLSKAVVEGKPWEAPINTLNYLNGDGKKLAEQIPKSVWECLKGSDDVKNVSAKLGIDVASEEFGKLSEKFVNNHVFVYYGFLNVIKHNLDQHNFSHAGSAKGHLLAAIAKTKKN